MESWMRQWASNNKHNLRIKRKEIFAESIENIVEQVVAYANENSIVMDKFETKIIERTTSAGFYMGLHRDDYLCNETSFKKGNTDDSLWKPIYQKERPVITVIWYQSTQGIDFVGGNLRFHDGFVVKPKKMLVLFLIPMISMK